MPAMVVVIDNYDSFTYNLVHLVCSLGWEVKVFRNDRTTPEEVLALGPGHLIISPGPGRPVDAGISRRMVAELAGRLPILGVCLGHQVVGEVFGGSVIRAGTLVHGKTSRIRHRGGGILAGLPDPFEAMRYHSLVLSSRNLPACLEVTAWLEEDPGVIMGLRHKELPVEGIQFHPESFMTPEGRGMMSRFLAGTLARHGVR